MTYLVRLGRGTADGIRCYGLSSPTEDYAQRKVENAEKGTDGRDEALAEYRKQYYEDNSEKRRAQPTRSRGDYFRQYYLRTRNRNAEAMAKDWKQYYSDNSEKKNTHSRVYFRQYYLENKEKRTGKKRTVAVEQDGEAKEVYRRLYNLQNREMKAQYRSRYEDSKPRSDQQAQEYRRQYHLQKKEMKAEELSQNRTNLSWSTPESVREYFDSKASRLNILNITDWYRVSRKQMGQTRGEEIELIVWFVICVVVPGSHN